MRIHQQSFLALLAAICGGTLIPTAAALAGRYEPRCEANPPTCEAQPNCEAPPKPCQPCQPPPAAPVYMAPQGMFVQPQGSGPVRGPVEQTGIEGASLTFPELRLRMPSFRFPSTSRYRENARMELNPSSAPYVEAPAAPMMAAPMQAPMMQAPMMAAPMQAPMMQAPMMAAAPVMQAPMMYVPAAPTYPPAAPYYAPQTPPQQAPPQQAPPPPAAPPQQGPPYAPQCDGRAMGFVDPLDEKLRRIEAAEQRLQAQVVELQRLMAQMPNATAAAPVNQNQIPLRSISPGGLRPAEVHQPLAPPQPPPDLGRRQPVYQPQTPQPQYAARPAGYYADPPAANHVISQPASNVIREPAAPRGQISRLR